MSMEKNVGLAWHVHHEILVEWCYDYAERVAYIKSDKPKAEQATRLRLFRFVKSPPAAVVEAWKAYDEAWKARDEAWKAYVEAGKAYVEAGKARDEAWKAYVEVGKARDEALAKAMPELEKLHAVECTNCTWDGRTIFPEAAR